MKPHLDLKSLAEFEDTLKGAQTYVEYGCGGSTVRAVELGVENIIVAESDPIWAYKVQEYVKHILRPHQTIHFETIDFGIVGEWGTPKNPQREKALAYVESVWDKLESLGFTPDAVLIDGRFRVACACEVLLRSVENTKVMFDDAFRNQYSPFMDHVDEYRRLGRMMAFRTSNVNAQSVIDCRERHILSVI